MYLGVADAPCMFSATGWVVFECPVEWVMLDVVSLASSLTLGSGR